MITDHFKTRDFQIMAQRPDAVNFWTQIDGCAQFKYKGLMISMSTAGRSMGACMQPVAIYDGNEFQNVVKDGLHTVEDAIRYIDEMPAQQKIKMSSNEVYYKIMMIISKEPQSMYMITFRQYLFDTKIDPLKFVKCLDQYLEDRPIIDRDKFINMLTNGKMTAEEFRAVMQIFNVIPD